MRGWCIPLGIEPFFSIISRLPVLAVLLCVHMSLVDETEGVAAFLYLLMITLCR